ncbi:folliculin [Copidosoma floridanum]|uniref:folliculin n=1 Tax=Copidosoma floridanum TaxID=29053 RepID=UPI0006C9AD6C|nr:folliculin [Copidosoma floridanum]
MNAAIALCSFCEVHGPKVMFTTQTFKNFDYQNNEKLKFYGSKEVLRDAITLYSELQDCKGCSSLGYLKFLSNEHETRTSFLSSQQSLMQDIGFQLKCACMRSLSCEEYAGKEGICYFDEPSGHVLSYTFPLKDAQARGLRRWYSFIVFMRDKQFLLNMWPFIVENLSEIIRELQGFAEKKYNVEEARCPQRVVRLTLNNNVHPGSQTNANNQPRTLTEITDEEYVFVRIHMWFVWILSIGASHFVEILPLSLLGEDINFNEENCLGMDDNFTLNNAKYPVNLNVDSRIPDFQEVSNLNPMTVLRNLRSTLGRDQFRQILYAVLTGIKILVRGSARETLESLYALCSLVPRACRRVKTRAQNVPETNIFNFISVDTSIAVPLPCSQICRLDIVPADHRIQSTRSHVVKWTGVLPVKLPNLLIKLEKAFDNKKLNDSLLESYFYNLQEEWTNIAKVIHATHGQIHRTDLTNLMTSLGAGPQDKNLLDAWSMGLPSNPA